MNSKEMGADIVYAWPIAEVAVMGAEGAVNIMFRREIEAAPDPEAKRKELIQAYDERFLTPYQAAARGYVDEIIMPEQTREKIFAALKLLKNKTGGQPPRKHGNMPL